MPQAKQHSTTGPVEDLTDALVADMGALFWGAVDPSVLPDTRGLATEAARLKVF
jgi:hypothetical protein